MSMLINIECIIPGAFV